MALAFAVVVLLTFLGSTIGLWQSRQLRTQAERLHQVNAEAIAILRVNNDVLQLQETLQQPVEAQDAVRFEAETDRLSQALSQDVAQAIELLSASPFRNQEARYTTQLSQLADIATLSSQIESLADLARAGDWPAVQRQLETQTAQLTQITQNLVNEIEPVVANERELALRSAEQTRQQALLAISVAGLLALLAAAILGTAITRSLTRPLARLDAGAQALARQEFDYRVGASGRDEVATVSRAFDEAAAQLAELYAGLEEMVWERTDELQRRAMQLETNLAVGQRLASILDLDTLLNEVVELIKARYGYYYVGVFLLADSGETVTVRAGTGQAGQTLRQQGFSLTADEASLVGWVAKHRRLERIDNVAEDKRYVYLEIVPETRSELALPLAMGKRLLGVLDIHSNQVAAFRLDDLPVLQSLADQVAIAIQNAFLYQGEQTRRRLAETLYQVGRSISSTLDLKDVLTLTLDHLIEIVSYDRAAVMLQSGDDLEIVAARGFPKELDPGQLRVPLHEDDVFQQIYQSKQPLIISDVLQREDWQHMNGLPPARAWLGVPLIRFNKVIGMLSLTRERPNAYSNHEATLAATFAGQAAIALENARLYDKIARFTQQLEDMVRERTDALREAYIQLEHLDRTKSDFINIAAHELRTPLTILQGYSKMLLSDPNIEQNASRLEMISSIHSGAIRLHEVVNSMLDVAKIDSRALKLYPEPVSIRILIEMVCQKFTGVLAERRLTLTLEDLDDLPAIEADPDALTKVFHHLIVNAIKYTPDGGTITISGTTKRNGLPDYPTDGIELVISDTGIGIDSEFKELVFTKFYQTGEIALHSSSKVNFKGAGPGLGLAVVRGIVEAHRGQVWVESPGYDEETCPGSHFHLFLPLRQPGSQAPER
jgi:signal transduction histidine kinase/nitrate/nitrite-specific signal transduction histidine kinase